MPPSRGTPPRQSDAPRNRFMASYSGHALAKGELRLHKSPARAPPLLLLLACSPFTPAPHRVRGAPLRRRPNPSTPRADESKLIATEFKVNHSNSPDPGAPWGTALSAGHTHAHARWSSCAPAHPRGSPPAHAHLITATQSQTKTKSHTYRLTSSPRFEAPVLPRCAPETPWRRATRALAGVDNYWQQQLESSRPPWPLILPPVPA